MVFKTKSINTICSGQYAKSLLLFLLDAIAINAAYVLTTGTVLSGYLIHLGAGDFLTAFINNSMNYSTILSLFSFVIYERMSRRKNFLLTLNAISRLMICLIVALPLLISNKSILLAMVSIMVIASDIIWGIYRVGWLVWTMEMVPKESKTRYVYMRTFLLRAAMAIATIASGFILDIFNKSYMGFVIVFAASFILSLADLFILKNTDEVQYDITKNYKISVKLFLQPVMTKKYRNFLLFIFSFYLCLTMSSCFTNIYLIRYLKFNYKFISTINVISLVIMIAFNPFWGRVENRKGFRFVLGTTSMLIAGQLVFFSLLKGETYYLLYIATVLSGIGMGGFGASIFTYRYEIMPENGKTIYEGWFYFASGLSMFLAPFIGNFIAVRIPASVNLGYFTSKYQILYIISFFLLSVVIFTAFIKPGPGNRSLTHLKHETKICHPK